LANSFRHAPLNVLAIVAHLPAPMAILMEPV